MNHSLRLCTLLCSVLATQAFAATASNPPSAKVRYQQELAQCKAANPQSDGSCEKDARHALAEIQRGKMAESWKPGDFEAHALARCEAHQGADKADCIARMGGQGKAEGSVAAGGILRELTTTTIVAAPPVKPVVTPPPETPRPSGLMANCQWVPPLQWVCK